MRWQLNNEKYYIGPVTESQIDKLTASSFFKNSGIACIAGNGKVELYITVSANDVGQQDLNIIKFMNNDIVMLQRQ